MSIPIETHGRLVRRLDVWAGILLVLTGIGLGPTTAEAQTATPTPVPTPQPGEPNGMEKALRYLDKVQYLLPGTGLGVFRIGMPLEVVVAELGTPLSSERSGVVNRRTTLIYEVGIDAYIKFVGDRLIEEIGAEGLTSFQTPEGIQFGTPGHQIRLIYGEGETDDSLLDYPDRGIEFALRSGLVFQIRIYPVESD